MPFPQTRLRRLRASGALRGLVRETSLSASDFVYPMFVAQGIDRREPIEAMPAIDRLSIAHAVDDAREAAELGIPAVLLFGLPAAKDEEGSGAWDDEGVVQLATRAITGGMGIRLDPNERTSVSSTSMNMTRCPMSRPAPGLSCPDAGSA
jgi:porphobilinogen synthase